MLAVLAFEPVICAGFQVERQGEARAAAPELDPELAALAREIRQVEGEPVAEPPLLFRLVELCGICMIMGCVAGLASGLAALVA
jgi:hypothetical protein